MRFSATHAIIVSMKHLKAEWTGWARVPIHNRNYNRRLRIPSLCQKHGVKKIRPDFPSDISDSIFLTESLVICPVFLSSMVFLSADGQRSKKGFSAKRTHFRRVKPRCVFQNEPISLLVTHHSPIKVNQGCSR